MGRTRISSSFSSNGNVINGATPLKKSFKDMLLLLLPGCAKEMGSEEKSHCFNFLPAAGKRCQHPGLHDDDPPPMVIASERKDSRILQLEASARPKRDWRVKDGTSFVAVICQPDKTFKVMVNCKIANLFSPADAILLCFSTRPIVLSTLETLPKPDVSGAIAAHHVNFLHNIFVRAAT